MDHLDAQSGQQLQEAMHPSLKFELFRGECTESGKIRRVRHVGAATLHEGASTYVVRLKALLNDTFYLLPEGRTDRQCNYGIMTRELAVHGKRRFFWHRVGEAFVMGGENHGLMRMEWDLFPGAEIYMNLYPSERRVGVGSGPCVRSADRLENAESH
jgi:hypothetical protein